MINYSYCFRAFILYQLNRKGINKHMLEELIELIERWKNVARRLRTIGAIKFERYNKNLAELVTSSSPIIISGKLINLKIYFQLTDINF